MNLKRVDGKAPGASENTAFTIGFKLPVRPKGCPYCGHDLELKLSDDPVKQFSWKCTSCEYHRPNAGYQNHGLNELRDEIYEDAVAHGLWEEDDDLSDDLLDDCYDLILDEVSELDGAIEEWVRTGYHNHSAEELADVVIMCFSVAGRLGIDIDAAIHRKMEINKQRPWKHGKE